MSLTLKKTVEVLEKADKKFSEAYVVLRNHAAGLESSLESTDFYLNLKENTKARNQVILRLTKVVYSTLQPAAKEDLKLLDALLTDLEDEDALSRMR